MQRPDCKSCLEFAICHPIAVDMLFKVKVLWLAGSGKVKIELPLVFFKARRAVAERAARV
jgi:hypothetical protein